MRRCLGFLVGVFLSTFLISGSALAVGSFTFEGPAGPVVVGQQFTVNVYLNVTGGPPTQVCGYQYCVNYDQSLVSMVPVDLPCTTTPTDPACDPPPELCIALPPADGGFFRDTVAYQGYRTCSDDCTAPYSPVARNCSLDSSLPHCDPANIFYADQAGLTFVGPGFAYPCAHGVPFPGRELVSTYTFQAKEKIGCFQFVSNPVCVSEVTDCDTGAADNMTIDNSPGQICIVGRPPSVPALSSHGTVVLALILAGSLIFLMRKYSGTKRSKS